MRELDVEKVGLEVCVAESVAVSEGKDDTVDEDSPVADAVVVGPDEIVGEGDRETPFVWGGAVWAFTTNDEGVTVTELNAINVGVVEQVKLKGTALCVALTASPESPSRSELGGGEARGAADETPSRASKAPSSTSASREMSSAEHSWIQMPHLAPDVGSDTGGAGGRAIVGRAVGRGIKPPSSSSESDMVERIRGALQNTVCV